MTEPTGLVAWLRAQLDEDASIAREVADDGDGQWRLATYADGTTTAWHGDVEVMTSLCAADAVHIRNWDPARVLAEVDAKRRILDAHEQADARLTELWMDNTTEGGYASGLYCAVRLLALPYADRPGYRPEWAPDAG